MGLSRRHIHPAVEASLRRLGAEATDLYMTHDTDPGTPLEQVQAVAVWAAVESGRPVAVRFPRGSARGVALDPDPKPQPLGRGELLPYASYYLTGFLPYFCRAGARLVTESRAGGQSRRGGLSEQHSALLPTAERALRDASVRTTR